VWQARVLLSREPVSAIVLQTTLLGSFFFGAAVAAVAARATLQIQKSTVRIMLVSRIQADALAVRLPHRGRFCQTDIARFQRLCRCEAVHTLNVPLSPCCCVMLWPRIGISRQQFLDRRLLIG
jgi:hypothetical protein